MVGGSLLPSECIPRARLRHCCRRSLDVTGANCPICAAVTGDDGPWNMPLNNSLKVARGCVRKSI